MERKLKCVAGLSVAALLTSGCVSQTVIPTVASTGHTRNIDYAAVDDVSVLIARRAAEYDEFIFQARQRGMYGGAFRGALIGLLLEADPLVVGGATFIGGLIGAKSGEATASNLVEQHKNYIRRRWSLERIRASINTDIDDTQYDLILSQKMKAAAKTSSARTSLERERSNLTAFKSHALTRALTLREVMPIYEQDSDTHHLLEIALKKQLRMISEIEENLRFLKSDL